MADDTKLKYIVELLTQGDTKKATDELNKLHAAGKKSSEGMVEMGRQFRAAFAVIAGSALVHQSINAFLEQERAIAKLNAALKATGEFTPQLSEDMQKLAESMSQVSLFADEAILNVIAKLTAAGAKTQDIERLTRAVLDLSTLMDRDLNRATQAFSMALKGEVGALKQAGIEIDETANATGRLNQALEQVEKMAGGQSAEGVKTVGGQFELFTKNIKETKEQLGGLIVETINPFIEALAKIAGLLNTVNASMRGFLPAALRGALLPGNPAVATALGAQRPGDQSESVFLSTDFGPGPAHTPMRAVKPPNVTTDELTAQDWKEMGEQIQRIGEASAKASERRADAEERYQTMLEDRAVLMEQEYQASKQLTQEQQFQIELAQLKADVMLQFAGGLSTAIVSAFEEGDKAFSEFARNFMKQVAQMILQMLIMKALTSIFGGGGQAGSTGGGGGFKSRSDFTGNLAASGGVYGLDSPTFFPKFNVLAGEAGREVMTVLSRPRFERINGVPAQVGMAGGNRLAITSADALASGGGGVGGTMDIRITLSPEVKAEVMNNSIKGARLQIIQDLHDDTPVSRGVKALTT